MSNYCQILLYLEGYDEAQLLTDIYHFREEHKLGYTYDWEQYGEYVHFSQTPYWYDFLSIIRNIFPFDWAFVKNDCMQEGGFVNYDLKPLFKGSLQLLPPGEITNRPERREEWEYIFGEKYVKEDF